MKTFEVKIEVMGYAIAHVQARNYAEAHEITMCKTYDEDNTEVGKLDFGDLEVTEEIV